MSTTSYHAHRAAGLCGTCGIRAPIAGQAACVLCQAKHRASMRRQRLPQATRIYNDLLRKEMGCGILVGCCGRWHNADTIPWTAPCCGRLFFAPAPEGAAHGQ